VNSKPDADALEALLREARELIDDMLGAGDPVVDDLTTRIDDALASRLVHKD
jgi:hypothetical protein